MRYHPDAIRKFLIDQADSGRSVAHFCTEHELNVATFYSWRKKYRSQEEAPPPEGFCKIIPHQQTATKKLRLPSGLELELSGMTTMELSELLLAIDQAYA